MKAFLRSFVYAFQGWRAFWADHRNFRIQLILGVAVAAAGIYAGLTAVEWCIILLCAGLVLSLEMVNSAIENLVNLVSPEKNPLAGKVKDIAAGAVLLASATALAVAGVIFWKYLAVLF